MRVRRSLSFGIIGCIMLLAASACSITKYVPEGKYLLDKVDIKVGDDSKIDRSELYNFLRQSPNHKAFGFARMQLGAYSLSGRDSTRWYNRWLRSMGQPPVIYDSTMTLASVRQLRQALINSGYTKAVVTATEQPDARKRTIGLNFTLLPGTPLSVDAIHHNVNDTALYRCLNAVQPASLLYPGMLLDRNVLDNERNRVTQALQQQGYYAFSRDYISYTVDTVRGSRSVELTMTVMPPAVNGVPAPVGTPHKSYRIAHITFVVEGNPTSTLGEALRTDTVEYRGNTFIFRGDRYLRPSLLDDMCYLAPGQKFSSRNVERTYEALGRLSIVKFINIEMVPEADRNGKGMLHAYIMLSRNRKQTATFEVEGTNSEGDLGFGVGLTYQHRNIAKGSELLTAKVRTSYESLSGDFEGLINNRYNEVAGELGLTFPKFMFPFLSKNFKQRLLASTEFTTSANYQERPEYTRVIFGGAWKWKWQHQRLGVTRRQNFDLIDINYVRLPHSTIDFINQIAPGNPLLRYSYEDHFIMRMGYNVSLTNRRAPSGFGDSRALQRSVYTLRMGAETAGNVLYGISRLFGQERSGGVYKFLGTQYAQYAKADFDYTHTHRFTQRSSVAYRIGAGVAVPYGNSSMVPFEKRFYAGGANGVRGWSVRTLGPGTYDSHNSMTDFINQCGDIRLDLSAEYRAKLFWILEGAVFVDAGNIWTIRPYENQPGGFFRFNSFYKEIAAAYGMGLRLDFNIFLVRLDLGMKAHNPAQNAEPWPLLHPRFSRDANFHFAVGYPF